MEKRDLQRANRRLIARLTVVVVAMFGFSFALIPLYDTFCEITGLNGKTGRIRLEEALAAQVNDQRWVTVELVGLVNGDLPWDFRPLVNKVRVHPGEVTEAQYWARNRSGEAMTGRAVPSLAPGLAARYFNKTECFCFTRQTLGPGEGREMPVRFVVDPNLPPEVSTLSLSYTFFAAPQAPAGADG
jgi:cytochrome c oxidase assembly protein subunit 11